MDRQQGLPNITNQLTAYGRIGVKNERLQKRRHHCFTSKNG